MPPLTSLPTVIAFIWDFDKTLTPAYMQKPLFDFYGIDEATFWREVNSLQDFYAKFDLTVAKDTAYLEHILNYVRDGRFGGLTNGRLREFGATVELAPGMPDFIGITKKLVEDSPRFKKHGITVEHYVLSTGLRQMIEGNPIFDHLDGVWACELLPAAPTSLDDAGSFDQDGELAQIGYTIDNTTKTRGIFEINKGVRQLGIDVNAFIPEEDRRVPFSNMIYIADGPSDIPAFSVVRTKGGQTLAVHTGGNYDQVQTLQDTSRVNHTARADYTTGSDAFLWLTRALTKIANKISDQRERSIADIVAGPDHVTK